MADEPIEVQVAGKTMKALRDVFDAVKMRDAAFRLGPNGISICAVDPAHVALAEAILTLERPPAEETEVMVSMEKYKEAAKPFFADEQVTWALVGNTLTFKVGRRRRTIGLLDPRTSTAPRIPNVPWPLTFKVPNAFLRRCNKDGPNDLDIITLSVNDGVFRWYAGNDEGTDVFEDLVDVEAPGASESSMFTRDYLADVLDPAVSADVIISLGSNMPVKFEYAVDGGSCKVLLAPRIISE